MKEIRNVTVVGAGSWGMELHGSLPTPAEAREMLGLKGAVNVDFQAR